MYTRDTGLAISLIAGAIAGVGYFIGWVSTRGLLSGPPEFFAERPNQRKSKRRSTLADRMLNELLEVLGGASAIALGIGVFGSVFCLLFAILNPLMQLEELTQQEIKRQLADGTLVLRITTDLLGKGGSQEFATEMEGIPAYLGDERRRVRDTTQSAIFVAALFILWLLSAHNVRTPLTTFLAYVFAFFSDDWSIMLAYSRVLKGRLLRWHLWRIHFANALLLIPLAIITWQEFGWWGIVVWYVAVFYLLFARYGYSLERLQKPALAIIDPPPGTSRQ